MRLRYLAFAAASWVIGSPATAGDKVLYGAAPEWVKPVTPGDEDEEGASLPVRVLLLDTQHRLEGERQARYSAFTLKFQTPQGLSAGNLSFPWRPESDELTVHKVLIRRGDQVIDVLGAGQTFSVLRREQNLDMAMLDGVLTANMFPEGLQVGDVLEVATTLVSSDPVLKGHSEVAIGPLNGSMARAHVRLQWPSSTKMQLGKTADLPDWRRTREGGFETAELTLDNPTLIPIPDNVPDRYRMVRFVEASDFGSWAALAEIFVPLYRDAARIPPDGLLRAEVDKIRAASNDPIRQAEAALELVQSRIRYVALAMGEGGLVPASATDTWTRRYGDCKAKTALLLAILADLGIDAEAVVVNAVAGDTIGERLPSAAAFNHVIVRARIEGREYWMDGTRTGDTSLARLVVPYHSWGLPIRAGAELVRMVPPPLTEPSEDIAVRMDASKGVRAAVPTEVELTLRGDAAVQANNMLANFIGENRERALREYWRGRFSFIEPERVGMQFDEAMGEMRLMLVGAATLDWDGQWYETEETRVGGREDFTREQGYAVDAPFALNYPIYSRTRQTIVLPPNFTVQRSPDWTVDETVAGLEYKRHVQLEGNTFVVERSERSLAPEFPASEATAAQKRLLELWNKPVYLRIPDNYRPAAGDLAEADPGSADNVRDLVAQGSELLNAARYDDALVNFTRATELQPENGSAWANRGLALAWQNKFEEALDNFARAEAIDPSNPVIYRGRGLAYERQRNFAAALRAFDKAVELDPGSAFAWGHRATTQMSLNKPHAALTDAEEAIKLSPRYMEMYLVRAFALMGLGRREDASAELTAMLRALPDDARAVTAAREFYGRMGEREKARALLDPQTEEQQTPASLVSRARLHEPADTAAQLADLSQALQLDPKFSPALWARAQLYMRRYDWDLALADADQLVQDDENSADRRLLRASILQMQGRNADAVADLKALALAHPDNAAVRTSIAQAYIQMAMTAEAAEELERAVESDPEFGHARLQRANLYHAEGKHDLALEETEAALRFNPAWPEVNLLRANIFRATGRKDDALAEASVIVKSNPTTAWAHVAAGKIYSRFDMRAEALAAIDQAIEMDPQALYYIDRAQVRAPTDWDSQLGDMEAALKLGPSAQIQFTKGHILLRKGDFAGALAAMSEAAKAEPDSPYFLNGRGMAYAKAGQAKEAEADFSQASTLARDAMTLNNICYSKAYQGVGLQHALADCERSLTLSPDVPGTLDSRGTVFLRLGWLDEAIGDFDKVIAKTPGMAQSRYLRAVARSKKGDLAGAREDVEAARKESAETVADLERQGFVLAMENAS